MKARSDKWDSIHAYERFIPLLCNTARSECVASAHKVKPIHNYLTVGNHSCVDGHLKCNFPNLCYERAVLYKEGTARDFHIKVQKKFKSALWRLYKQPAVLTGLMETEDETNARLGCGVAQLVQGNPTLGPASFGYATFKYLMDTYCPEIVKNTARTCMCHYCMKATYRLDAVSRCLRKCHCYHTCHSEQKYANNQIGVNANCTGCVADNGVELAGTHEHKCDCEDACCLHGKCTELIYPNGVHEPRVTLTMNRMMEYMFCAKERQYTPDGGREISAYNANCVDGTCLECNWKENPGRAKSGPTVRQLPGRQSSSESTTPTIKIIEPAQKRQRPS